MSPALMEQQAVGRVNRYNDQLRAYLYQAVGQGIEEKVWDGIGKEYYAVSNYRGDTIIHWTEAKVKELYPELAKRPYSVNDVLFTLSDKHVIKVSHTNEKILYIHKKRFKRVIKKAVMKALY